jgi:hypothetical protein
MPYGKFASHVAYEPEALSEMGAAFDAAIAATECVTEEVKELYATRIMAAVVDGERDVAALTAIALRMYPAFIEHHTSAARY